MIETVVHTGHEADFAAWEAELDNLGGLAVSAQIEQPAPTLPDPTPAEVDAFAANLEAWNNDSMFTAEDRKFLKSHGITARAMTDTELRANAQREKAAELAVLQAHEAAQAAYGVQEQASIGLSLRKRAAETTDDDEEPEEEPYPLAA